MLMFMMIRVDDDEADVGPCVSKIMILTFATAGMFGTHRFNSMSCYTFNQYATSPNRMLWYHTTIKMQDVYRLTLCVQ
jgi:hypothetical protein